MNVLLCRLEVGGNMIMERRMRDAAHCIYRRPQVGMHREVAVTHMKVYHESNAEFWISLNPWLRGRREWDSLMRTLVQDFCRTARIRRCSPRAGGAQLKRRISARTSRLSSVP